MAIPKTTATAGMKRLQRPLPGDAVVEPGGGTASVIEKSGERTGGTRCKKPRRQAGFKGFTSGLHRGAEGPRHSHRIARGGSCLDDVSSCRPGIRHKTQASRGTYGVGLRVVLSPRWTAEQVVRFAKDVIPGYL